MKKKSASDLVKWQYAIRYLDQRGVVMSGEKQYGYTAQTFNREQVEHNLSTYKRLHPEAVIVTRLVSEWEEV